MKALMSSFLKNQVAAFDPARLARIRTKTERFQAESMPMHDLRKTREITQVRLTKILGKRQVTVTQVEKRRDVMLSTLRS
jgi:hypothetical protein